MFYEPTSIDIDIETERTFTAEDKECYRGYLVFSQEPNLPARKPQAGQKQTLQNADSGKMETTPKGLGHWRCTGCNKIAKVTPRKPEVKTEVPKESTDGI